MVAPYRKLRVESSDAVQHGDALRWVSVCPYGSRRRLVVLAALAAIPVVALVVLVAIGAFHGRDGLVHLVMCAALSLMLLVWIASIYFSTTYMFCYERGVRTLRSYQARPLFGRKLVQTVEVAPGSTVAIEEQRVTNYRSDTFTYRLALRDAEGRETPVMAYVANSHRSFFEASAAELQQAIASP